MLNALSVCKRMVQVLDEFVLPALQSRQVTQVYGGVPLALSQVEHWNLQEALLPDKDMHLQVHAFWEKEGVLTCRMPMLGFVFQGVSVERIGVTKSMAAKLQAAEQSVPDGVTAFRLTAPAAYYCPADIPRYTGHSSSEKKALSRGVPLGILAFDFLETEGLVRLFESNREDMQVLQIVDQALVELGATYANLIRQGNFADSQPVLVQFMRQLRHALSHLPIQFANTSWPPTDTRFSGLEQASPNDRQLCTRLIEYVQTHLHRPLTRTLLAQQMGVSSVYLNRVFLRTTGLTVMRFVTQCRIEAAKYILRLSEAERVGEIAILVGFANADSFTAVFTRETGLSPSAYRKQHKQDKQREVTAANHY